MKPTGHNKWGKCMNINKDKKIIRIQPNNISEWKIKCDSGKYKQIYLGGKKCNADTVLQHRKKNRGNSNCV